MFIRAGTNRIKSLTYNYPDRIPVSVSILPAAWMRHREALDEVVARHPSLFGPRAPGGENGELIDVRADEELGERALGLVPPGGSAALSDSADQAGTSRACPVRPTVAPTRPKMAIASSSCASAASSLFG